VFSTIITSISSRLKGDRYIWTIVALLSLVSMLMIYSATETLAYRQQKGDTEYYLIKQIGILGVSLAVMYVCHRVPYMRYARMAVPGMVISVLLLLVTLFSGLNLNSARRWLEVPLINLSFQTSDLAKLGLIIYLAKVLSQQQEKPGSGSVTDASFWRIFGPVLLTCGLIAPANLSTAIILFATCFLLMVIGQIEMRYLGYVAMATIGFFAVLILVGEVFPSIIRLETWISRVKNFVSLSDPDVRYQVEQAKIAISKGGLFGVGPGNGTQSSFVPHAYSDYIYCIIIEEFGLFGGFAVLFLYFGLLMRSVRLVTLSNRAFGSLLAIGLSLMLVIQALANMAVSVHIIPVTGLTLPLISLGGTSLVFTCMSLGIILSVSQFIENEHRPA
jgi:cell division protein FtsW